MVEQRRTMMGRYLPLEEEVSSILLPRYNSRMSSLYRGRSLRASIPLTKRIVQETPAAMKERRKRRENGCTKTDLSAIK